MSSSKPSTKFKNWGEVYLFLYNFVQTAGWAVLLYHLARQYITTNTYADLYKRTEAYLLVFQSAAILEVLHAALGVVRSGVTLTAFQVASRLLLTWGVAWSVPQVQSSVGVALLLLAWSVTEVIRYGYYCCSLLHYVPGVLVWLRYTLFILLYPIGVSGELLALYSALPHIRRTGLYSVSLPNAWNMSFCYASFLQLAMLAYVPIFPQLYMHMFSQRKKTLWPKPPAKNQ